MVCHSFDAIFLNSVSQQRYKSEGLLELQFKTGSGQQENTLQLNHDTWQAKHEFLSNVSTALSMLLRVSTVKWRYKFTGSAFGIHIASTAQLAELSVVTSPGSRCRWHPKLLFRPFGKHQVTSQGSLEMVKLQALEITFREILRRVEDPESLLKNKLAWIYRIALGEKPLDWLPD